MIAGRLRKAEQFLESAETIREFADEEQEVAENPCWLQPPTRQHTRPQTGAAQRGTPRA
jgi:hypothetical protein